MKVALIFPRYKYPTGDPPLGIAYIAAYAKKETDAEIEIIDTTFDQSDLRMREAIQKGRYDIVAISAMTSMIGDAFKVAKLVKAHNASTKVIIGGPHATVAPEHALANPNVDAVIIGEGELTFADIIKKNGFRGINGVWYKEKGSIKKNKPREPIPDLDSLPYPALEFFDMKKYMSHWFQLDSVAPDLRGTSIIASRGCPYACTYCQPTLKCIFGNKIRKRSAKNIVDEIEDRKKRYNINAFMFQDDTLIMNKKWVHEICKELKERGIDLIWGCNVRANLVTYDLLKEMKEVGLRKVFMGIESGSQRILDEVYDKRITLAQVRNATKTAKRLGLKMQGYFMMGAPTETEKEINNTIRFARNLEIDEATFSITTPLPHTFLYDKTKQHILKNIEEFDYYKTPVYSEDIVVSAVKLKYLKKKAFLSFYLSPKRVVWTVSQFLRPASMGKSIAKLKRL